MGNVPTAQFNQHVRERERGREFWLNHKKDYIFGSSTKSLFVGDVGILNLQPLDFISVITTGIQDCFEKRNRNKKRFQDSYLMN